MANPASAAPLAPPQQGATEPAATAPEPRDAQTQERTAAAAGPVLASTASPLGAGTVAITAQEGSAPAPVGALSPYQDPRSFKHTVTTEWGGQKYVLTLNIPLTVVADDKNANARKIAADKFAKIFLADLKQKLDDSKTIKPGAEVTIVFEDDGYTALVVPPEETFNPNEPLDKYTTRVQAKDETSKQLSETIQMADVGQMNKTLDAPKFAKLAKAAEKAERKPAGPFRLIGVTGGANNLQAAFVQLVSNDPLRQELLDNPEYFEHGAENPLYVALKGYDDAQRDPKQTSFDLTALGEALEMTDEIEEQNDVRVAMEIFENQLSEDAEIPPTSLVHSLLEAHRVEVDLRIYDRTSPITPPTIPEVLTDAKKKAPFTTPPQVLSVHVIRDQADHRIALEGLTIDLPPSMHTSKPQYELRSYTINDAAADADPRLVVCVRDGNTFRKVDGDHVEVMTETDFLGGAAGADSLVFTRKITPPPEAGAPAAEPKPEPNVTGITTPIQRKDSSGNTPTSTIEETGRLDQAGPTYALVNFTDTTLADIQDGIPGKRQDLEAQIEAAKKGKSTWHIWDKKMNDKVVYKVGEAAYTPGTEKHRGIIHTVVPQPGNEYEENFKKAIKAALAKASEDGIQNVAFAAKDAAEARRIKTAVEEYAKENFDKVKPIRNVKIIQKPAPKVPVTRRLKPEAPQQSQPAPSGKPTLTPTLRVDDTGSAPTLANRLMASPAPAVQLGNALKKAFGQIPKDSQGPVEFDFTSTDTNLQGPNKFRINIGTYGFKDKEYPQALAVFREQTRDKAIPITLKIPKGVAVQPTAAGSAKPIAGPNRQPVDF